MNLKRNLFNVSLLTIILTVSIFALAGCTNTTTRHKASYEQDVDELNNDYDADIFVYGETVDFKYGLEYSHIDTLSEVVSDADYTYIIINLDETSEPLTENDLIQLISYMDNDHFRILYMNLGIYAEDLYSYDEILLGTLKPEEVDNSLLVDSEIELAITGDYSEISTIVHLMIYDIRRSNEGSITGFDGIFNYERID